MRVTRMHLADGRELMYFDHLDSPVRSGADLCDVRDLPPVSSRSELRVDVLTGDVYSYAAHRNSRTFMPAASEDPLAPSRPGGVPTEIPAADYDVVVFENRFPSFSGGVGRCEVVCFTPDAEGRFADLSVEQARLVVDVWAHRTAELGARPDVEYVFPFENRGEEIGVTLQHPHGQLYAFPFVPRRAAEIARRMGSNPGLFEDVVASAREAGLIVRETPSFVAFVPFAAKWPLELMIVPRGPVASFVELDGGQREELAELYLDMLGRVDRFFPGVSRVPYVASWNQAPTRSPELGRLHLQLFSVLRAPGRLKFLAGAESGQGAWISDTLPEAVAARLREVADV